MVKLNRKAAFEEEEEDPMTGVANLVDAMLVIAVGLLVFLVGTCRQSYSTMT